MTKYDKLVRDKVPEIIIEKGGTPVAHVATLEEYAEKLRKKLDEEIAEFDEDGNPEELADVLEVVYALAEHAGMSREELDQLREQKAAKRGGFKKRIILDES